MRFPRVLATLACLEAVALAGCPTDSDSAVVPGGPTAGMQAAPPGSPGATPEASTDGSTELTICNTHPLVQNTSATGPMLQVTLLTLDPAPPQLYTNDWVVEIKDQNGQPMTDASGLVVEPYMPEHGHGARTPPVLVPLDTPGQFDVTEMSLHMKGTWDIRFMRAEDKMLPANWTILYACVVDG